LAWKAQAGAPKCKHLNMRKEHEKSSINNNGNRRAYSSCFRR
jgi:hypothetical protein